MRKIFGIFSLIIVLSSCGPKRHGCGPNRRCFVEPPQLEIKKVPNWDFSILLKHA